MSSPRSPAVKTPLEDDDLLSEILLRLPPRPSSLPRASLVCKRWHGLASDPGFFRRFRRHHRRSPPLLGFFEDHKLTFVPTLEAPDRVPHGRFSLQRGVGEFFASLGCRHGLVLVLVSYMTPNEMLVWSVLVWDPVTGDQHRLTIPPGIAIHADEMEIKGAVLRSGGGGDHLQVVLTVRDNQAKQLACVYSSQTGLWGDIISTPLPSVVPRSDIANVHTRVFTTKKPAVLAGHSLYWVLDGNFQGILEFDLEKQSLAVIRVPVHILENGQFWNMRAEGGGLGLLLSTDSTIQLWKRTTDCDGVASWALGRTIELDNLLSLESQQFSAIILGFAEENNVVFLWTCGIHFMVHLESLQFKKLSETIFISEYLPFESVYTSETSIGDEHDAADLLLQT